MENNTKYWAREVNNERFNGNFYYTEDDAADENVWIGGNRQYKAFNNDLIEDVEKALDTVDYSDEEEIRDAFVKKDGSDLSDAQIDELKELTESFQTTGTNRDSYEIIADALTIIYGEPFGCQTIYGCGQGDWQYIIYPQTCSQEHINYIEAIYFGTGTEFEVTTRKITSDKFDDEIADGYETVNIYTCVYNSDEIKSDIAKQLNLPKNEIGLLLISGTHHVTTYDYREE